MYSLAKWFLIALSSIMPMPVSSTAILASGMRCIFAATAAAKNILSTCSWVKVEYSCWAALTLSMSAVSCWESSTPGFFSIFSFFMVSSISPVSAWDTILIKSDLSAAERGAFAAGGGKLVSLLQPIIGYSLPLFLCEPGKAARCE